MAKVKPLSTANYLPNQIPRLEPGLRIKSDLVADLQKLVFFTPIDWLRFLPEPVVIQAVASSEAADLTPKIQNNNPPFSLAKLRALVESLRESASNRFATYMKKVVTATLIVASSLSNPAYVRKIAKPLATAGLVAMAGTPLAATAGVLRKYTKLSPTQKLATTPLFYLANSNGQPFLQEDVQAGNPDQRIIVYFMSSEDATDYLEEMAQASGGNSNEFRVMTTSMEKVVNKIQSKKQSRKLGTDDCAFPPLFSIPLIKTYLFL